MTDEDYAYTQATLVTLATVVDGLDLGGFLARIARADSLGAILDPTLYRKASGPLEDVRELAASLQPFAREVARQKQQRPQPAGGA